MTFFDLLITDRCHIADHETRVRALLLITKIWATHAGPFELTGQKLGQYLRTHMGSI